MKIDWKATNEYYYSIINEPELKKKQALYRQYFLEAWKPMMQMVGGMFGSNSNDEFGVARAWGWHTPEELDHVPEQLSKLEAFNAWQTGEIALHKGVEAFANYDLPFDTVEGWLMLGVQDHNKVEGGGYTGAIDFMYPRFICQYFDVNDLNIKALSGAVVHEFNHLIRLRVFPWDMTKVNVGDYIVHEGIAESFATALFGEEVLGFYAVDIGHADLQIAKDLIATNIETTGFDAIRGFIFGDSLADKWGFSKVGMPNFGGYAVGFRVVQAFLNKTGCSVQEATFLPAHQIIAESEYFE